MVIQRCIELLSRKIRLSYPRGKDILKAFDNEFKIRQYILELLNCIIENNSDGQFYVEQERPIHIHLAKNQDNGAKRPENHKRIPDFEIVKSESGESVVIIEAKKPLNKAEK